MLLPLIPILLAFCAVACNRENKLETKTDPIIEIGPEPEPRSSAKPIDQFKLKGEQAVESYFNKLCQGYFSNRQDQPQQFCNRLWQNESLSTTEQQIRNKVFPYATHPLYDDLDPKRSYQELKIRPTLEMDLGKLLGKD